jgi:hypothetical protein
MNDTQFQAHYGDIVRNRANSYVPKRDGGYRYVALSYSTYGPSSLFSTVDDLARWDDNFYSAKVGGAAVLAALQEKGKLDDGKEIDYASGLEIGRHRGAATVSHSGADAGFRTNILRFPDHRFSVILLANAGDLDAGRVSLEIADICLDDALAPPDTAAQAYPPIVKTEIALAPEALTPFLGDFQLEPGFVISFTQDRGTLFTQATGQSRFPAYPSAPGVFFLKAVDAEFVFDRPGADGKVHGAVLHQNGRSLPLERLERFTLTPGQIQNRSGAFYSEELGVVYTIHGHDGALTLRYPRGDIALRQVGPDRFSGAFPIGTLTFSCDPDEACKGFAIDDGRVRNLKFRKVDLSAPPATP